MGRLDNTPQPVRDGIAAALMIGCVTATAAALLHQPLFLLGGAVLFFGFYFFRLGPQIKEAYRQEAEQQARYDDDATYQPILDRFAEDRDDNALIESYRAWKQGPHENETRLRFLQTAILSMIGAGAIYRVEELMNEMEGLAAEEGLSDRFVRFRAECDKGIAEIAQARLGQPTAPDATANDNVSADAVETGSTPENE